MRYLYLPMRFFVLRQKEFVYLVQGWANYAPRNHFLRPAGSYRNINLTETFALQWILKVEKRTPAGVDDYLFFALHLISNGKYDIYGNDNLFCFAFPISAALGFKNFSNAALRAKSLPTSYLVEQ